MDNSELNGLNPGPAVASLLEVIEVGDKARIQEALHPALNEIAKNPGDAKGAMLVGVGFARAGQFQTALTLLAKANSLDPRSFLAAYWLSVVLERLGRLTEAVEFGRKAAEVEPDNPLAQEHLGYCYLGLRSYTRSANYFRAALDMAPPSVSTVGGLGLSLKGQGRTQEACDAFCQSLVFDDKAFPSHFHLASCLAELGEGQRALQHANIALKLRPGSFEAEIVYGRALLTSERPAEALSHITRAIDLRGRNAYLLALLGDVRQMMGSSEEAIHAFREALEIDPVQPDACLGYARSRRVTDSDLPTVERMLDAIRRPELSLSSRVKIQFALGKSFEDLGNYLKAMTHYDDANRASRIVKYGDTQFDGQVMSTTHSLLIETCSQSFLSRNKDNCCDHDLPSFVIGMVRSGTTLAEQILSSHPEIEGIGERSFWLNRSRGAFKTEALALIQGHLKDLAKEYCEMLAAKAPSSKRTVDKMPSNYIILPIIHLALPKARFIHIRRHPVDTCISIWATPNSTRIDWAHDKENIVFAYRQYLRLMDAWRKVLPPGIMLEVDYEDLVANQERVTRKMISFLGLEWDDACLRPHERQVTVTTPSAWQVRQPVYKTSVARWRKYRPWLGAFEKLLTEDELRPIEESLPGG